MVSVNGDGVKDRLDEVALVEGRNGVAFDVVLRFRFFEVLQVIHRVVVK